MEIRSMNMDVLAEDTARYSVRVAQPPGSKDLELTLFAGFSGAVQMFVDSMPVERFLADFDTRRLLEGRTNVLFGVEAFDLIKNWVRWIWEATR